MFPICNGYFDQIYVYECIDLVMDQESYLYGKCAWWCYIELWYIK